MNDNVVYLDFQNLHDKIIQSTILLIKQKSLKDIELIDIAKQCKLSKQIILNYFKDIDDLIVQTSCYVLSSSYANEGEFKKDIDLIFVSSDKPEDIIRRYFHYMTFDLFRHSDIHYKISYEIRYLLSSDPVRKNNFYNYMCNTKTNKEINYAIQKLYQLILQNVLSGYFKPKCDVLDVFNVYRDSMDGIMKNLELIRCDLTQKKLKLSHIKKSMNGLCEAIISVLNVTDAEPKFNFYIFFKTFASFFK